MRSRQLMQLQIFLRTVLRKNRKIYIVTLLILTAVRIYAQKPLVSVSLSGNQVKIRMRMIGVSTQTILSSIQESQTAEIIFSIRLYQKRQNRSSRQTVLLKEVSKTQRGQWMPVIQRYMVQTDNSNTYFSSGQTFAAAFLSHQFILTLSPKQNESYYILSRIQLATIKFLPPFNILEPFFRDYYKTTPWVQTELSG